MTLLDRRPPRSPPGGTQNRGERKLATVVPFPRSHRLLRDPKTGAVRPEAVRPQSPVALRERQASSPDPDARWLLPVWLLAAWAQAGLRVGQALTAHEAFGVSASLALFVVVGLPIAASGPAYRAARATVGALRRARTLRREEERRLRAASGHG